MSNRADRKFGVELEFDFQGQGTLAVENLLYRNGFSRWAEDVHEDGSEIEISSPILQGAAGFRELKGVMQLLTAHGGNCYRSDGGHVHHDAPEFIDDPTATERLLDSWVNNRHLIEQFVEASRRNSYVCPPWAAPDIKRFKTHINDPPIVHEYSIDAIMRWRGVDRDRAIKLASCWSGNRNDLNLSSLGEHGTIEIRLHEGTLDFNVLYPWIKFGQYLLNEALKRKRPIPQLKKPEELLTRCRAAKHPAEALLARVETAEPAPFEPLDECGGCGAYPDEECYCSEGY